MSDQFKIHWVDHERVAKVEPDRRYPTGIDIDVSEGAAWSCVTPLPYPAPRCGMFVVECTTCGANALVTTAGRPDDPCSLRLACRREA